MDEDKMCTTDIEAEYQDIAGRNAWTLVYQKLYRESQLHSFTFKEARKPHNKPLNRYRDVSPYDHSRIVLKRGDKDYINANLVKMERANRKYILTQGPLLCTVGHFWLMVWEQNSRAILMLNKVLEKNEMKCYWYWPQGNGEANKVTLDDVKLVVEQIKEEDYNFYCVRRFKIYDMESSETREVTQFHYTTWPDFGVPSSPDQFLKFLKKVRESGALEPDVGPAIVHCSAGIGRSGTFCLVDSCLVIIEKEGSVDIQKVLLEMRQDRMGLIQTPDQLRFSYQAIIEGARRPRPGWQEPEAEAEESIYSTVAEAEADEEAPPPPPPRGESLTLAPVRPLPAIPASTSLGNLNYSSSTKSDADSEIRSDVAECSWDGSDSGRSTPSPRVSAQSNSSADEDDEAAPLTIESTGSGTTAETVESPATLRRRHTQQLSERIAAMKRRARSYDRWRHLKRSLYKPLTITFGVLLAGMLIYTYVKH